MLIVSHCHKVVGLAPMSPHQIREYEIQRSYEVSAKVDGCRRPEEPSQQWRKYGPFGQETFNDAPGSGNPKDGGQAFDEAMDFVNRQQAARDQAEALRAQARAYANRRQTSNRWNPFASARQAKDGMFRFNIPF